MSESQPAILTTTVGSYPIPDWLASHPTEQGVIDATRVVFDTQRQAGIDMPTDGEMYRFDVNHPETNGMIEYFVRPMDGVRTALGRSEVERFRSLSSTGFRAKPAGLVESRIGEGGLDLLSACQRTAALAGGPFKFTCTSPYMLARTLLDAHYGDFERLLMDLADVLASQVSGLPCEVLQVDEANIPGNPRHLYRTILRRAHVWRRQRCRRRCHESCGQKWLRASPDRGGVVRQLGLDWSVAPLVGLFASRPG